MTRRAFAHDYSARGIYHITIHVADGLGHPFGHVVGSLEAPDGSTDAPRVALTPVGQMVEQELRSIPSFYPMLELQTHVVMPEHLHFILEAHDDITSRNGKRVPLGTVIAGFKKGCNRRYWELTGQDAQAGSNGQAVITGQATATHQGKPDGANTASLPSAAPASLPSAASVGAPVVSPPSVTATPATQAPYKVPSKASTGRPSLFGPGFCDVMPLRAGQLATQRAYIKANPRNRLLRTSCPWLSIQRGGIATALTPAALRGYLQRECSPSVTTPEALAAIDRQLLLAPDGLITCDSFGDRQLLSRPLLPVVCHRKDTPRLSEQKARCLEAAQHGTILVSARIARGEQAIIDEAVNHGFPVILISDNGYPDRFHPSAERQALCATRHLLLLTPWQYKYRKAEANISPVLCKTMNCLAQALCRQKDSWWKDASK